LMVLYLLCICCYDCHKVPQSSGLSNRNAQFWWLGTGD
jgi:hypothetical protein